MDKKIFFIVPALTAMMMMAVAGGYSINKADEKPQGCRSWSKSTERGGPRQFGRNVAKSATPF